jgi:hypothetical protein
MGRWVIVVQPTLAHLGFGQPSLFQERLGKNRIDLVLYPYPCGEATPLEFRSIYPRFMTTSLNANPKAKICYHKLMLSTTHSLGITLQSKQTCISSLLTGMKSI